MQKTQLIRILAVIVLAIGLANGLSAGWFEDGALQYQTGNYKEAFKIGRKAAERGDAKAQNSLGVMYANGQGVTQDYKEAIKWYRKAAEQGNAYAQYNLGNMYYYGQGVTQDYKEAIKWYRKAAEQGDAKAQNNLGIMYATGAGVLRDYVQAHKWLNLAAANGDTKAKKPREMVAGKMTPAQIAEAQKLVHEWKPGD